MTAILGGLGAACCWAVAMLGSARASRTVGAALALAWVMLIGFVLTVPIVAASGSIPTGAPAGWLVLGGCGNVGGLLLEYKAVRYGKVGIVAAIVSTEGAIAALIAALVGEPVTAVTGAVLTLIAVGIVLASMGSGKEAPVDGATSAVLLSLAAALSFGIGLYATGHASGEVSLAWVVIAGRVVGVIALAGPLALRGRMPLPRGAMGPVGLCAVVEILGIVSYAIGARDSIGVASVLASQFAALAAVGAFVVFGERLRHVQVAGVAVIVAGVSALALLRV